jgi:sugar phosphate isomerase/epimerase
MSRIALQLYTVRDLCAEDLAGSLATTAALGFEGVELHDLYGHPADAVRRLLDENGLVASSRHASLPLIETEIEELAEELRVLGTDRLVVAWIEPPATAADADVVQARILAAAERAAEQGLRLGFHNHDGELAVLDDGSSMLGRLLAVEGGKLFLELDLGWVWYAGGDPLALLERAGTRAPLVHVKDLRNDGGPVHVPLGAGEVDYGRLPDAAGSAGVEWLILEQDETHGRGFEAVGESMAELGRLSGSAGAS